jgi:apolipoprotein D and lipocalin family protein
MARFAVYSLTVGLLCVNMAACATPPGAAVVVAPQPYKPVEAARFYTGVWHELARNPMKLTDGCVAGITVFSRGADNGLIDRDSCRMGDPETGKEKVFEGPVEILDATNAKFVTHYKVVGPFGVSRTYWILDHDDAYSWFITATPDMKNLSIFSRDPQLGRAERGALTERARALGYDPAGLEYPAQPKKR